MKRHCTLALGLLVGFSTIVHADEKLPMPNGAPPAPSSVCAASNAAVTDESECPTCGHHDVRFPRIRKPRPGLSRLCHWMFYRPTDRACRLCPKCVAPCHPPLYAWFPCQGGDCGGCGSEGCAVSGATRFDRLGRLVHGKQKCPKGQCGEFRFVGLRKYKFPAAGTNCADGQCANGQCGVDAHADASGPALPGQPVVVPPPAQQTVSYKPDIDGTIPVLKPADPKRVTTYRPNVIPSAMPVLSPDAFRKPKKP